MKFRIRSIKPTIIFAAFGSLVLISGLIFLTPALYFTWSNNGSVGAHGLPTASPQITVPAGVAKVSGNPVSISIPSLHMNLPVINGYYNKKSGQWTLTLDKAQFATISSQPNNIAGNTLIYGHYRPEVFAYLHLIKSGAEAVVTTDSGYQFTYKFYDTYPTSPNDTSVFTYTGAPMLTVQTCSGTWFQNRQMYQFSLVSFQKAG